jgi:hypothetical protein
MLDLESFVNDDVEELNGVLVELACCIPDLLESTIRGRDDRDVLFFSISARPSDFSDRLLVEDILREALFFNSSVASAEEDEAAPSEVSRTGRGGPLDSLFRLGELLSNKWPSVARFLRAWCFERRALVVDLLDLLFDRGLLLEELIRIVSAAPGCSSGNSLLRSFFS